MRKQGKQWVWMLALASLSVAQSAGAQDAAQRPDFSGRWVMDDKASTMPTRPNGPMGRGGGPPVGGPPGGARGGVGRGGMGARPEGMPREGGPRGTPREFTLEQYTDQILLSERGLPFRELVLTRERAPKSLAPEGTARSEARWEGEELVIDDQTRGGAARKQVWRLDAKDRDRLVITTHIGAEGEREAIDMKQVFTRSRSPE